MDFALSQFLIMKGVVIVPHLFSQVPKTVIPRSRFNRSHTYKTTCNAGRLIPFFWDSVLPSDSFNLRTTIFARMSTLISPIMDDLWIDTHYFFVPYRLIWNNFQKFMGEQENPDDSIDFVIPQALSAANYGTVEVESICDYLGLPIGNFYGIGKNTVSALPLRSYYLIWNEWFRDINVQDSIKVSKSDVGVFDGISLPNGFKAHNLSGSCLPRSKRHDYFTSALPWPARPLGDSASIAVPLGGTANVFGNGNVLGLMKNPSLTGDNLQGLYQQGGSSRKLLASSDSYGQALPYGSQQTHNDYFDGAALGVVTKEAAGSNPEASGLVADLTSATGVTINQLRQSFQIQKFLEQSARGGMRYTEILRSMFGTISPDARLQRPEYLGGSSHRMDVNVVPQTSASVDGVTPQANLAAFATGTNARGDGFTKSFVEHGIVMGFMSIRGPLIYQQGINREWSKKTRFDFYWPIFAHLGEQAVLNKEIYAQGTSADNDVFGYQERYAEYRYKPSMVTGKFRSTYSQPLDSWHLAQKFDSLPTLSNEFIQENPPVGRVVSVPSEPHFLVDINIQLDCARPMPLYGVPGLVDHF